MTDKQIIDGIDVGGCKHFKIGTCLADYLLTDMDFSEAKCELCKDCYYKQLKRKEQKLDKIKTICEKETTKSTFCNGIENKDLQKLAIKILKIIIEGKK